MTEVSDIPAKIPLEQQRGESFTSLVAVMRRLLGPGGCPWDREQTEESLRPYILEEACEVIDAIDSKDPEAICEELGDLSLQIAFLSELLRNQGKCGPDDVMRAICEKLVRRHPHVFGDVAVADSDEVVTNWNKIKTQEKANRRLLDSVPRSLPGLVRARSIGQKVASVGFDWPDSEGSLAKVREELGELITASSERDSSAMEAELGDLLFALVNYSRHIGVDAELALKKTADRFTGRFSHVEDRVRQCHGGWPDKGAPRLPLEELDQYWEEAKACEK
jgi:MazG family protein